MVEIGRSLVILQDLVQNLAFDLPCAIALAGSPASVFLFGHTSILFSSLARLKHKSFDRLGNKVGFF